MTEKASPKLSSKELLLQAAEEIMRENGYAAVTSRRVAAKAGLKPQLVHYYFRSMDELFVELYRQYASGLLEMHKAVLNAENPLREMWKVATEARGVLLSEFIALANHRKVIQAEIAEFGHQFRRSQIEVMSQIFETRQVEGFPWSPAFAALLLNSLARSLAVEGEFDITEGHAEARAVVEQFIEQFDRLPAAEQGG